MRANRLGGYSLALALLLVIALACFTGLAQANSLSDDYIIRPMGPGDQNFLAAQQKLGADLVYEHLLTRLSGDKSRDLQLLQDLLDRRYLKAHQRRELQALGSVLGQHLAKEFRLEWVVYVDEAGRSRGLQIDDTRQVIFPLTMISRRVEADARVDVRAIYQKASDIIRYTRANRPLYTR